MAEGSASIQRPVVLPVVRRAERVNDKAVKVLKLLYSVIFIFK